MTVQKEDSNLLRVGLAQIAPVWLDRARTLLKVETYVEQAAGEGCHLVVWRSAGSGVSILAGIDRWSAIQLRATEIHFCRVFRAGGATGGGASRWIVRSGRAAPHRNLPGNRRTPGRPRIAEPI